MNEAIVFDTHRFVRNLTASGFTERQAEALANEQVQLLEGNLATKADLEAVRLEIEAVRLEVEGVRQETANVKTDLETQLARVKADLEVKIANVQSNLEVKIANVQSNLLKWVFAALVAQSGVLATLIALL